MANENDKDFSAKTDAEISAKVAEEIKHFGAELAAIKAVQEEMLANHHQLKKTVDEQNVKDPVIMEKLDKLTADISTRQEHIDKKMDQMKNRTDQLEVAFKRPLMGPDDKDLDGISAKAFAEFQNSIKAVNGKRVEQAQMMDYRKEFISYLRNPGDERQLSPDAMKTLSVGVDPDGGYTVSPQLSNRVVERMFEMDPIRSLASVENITTNAIEFMVDRGQAGAGWESETSAGGETTTPDFGRKRIPVDIMYAKPRATQQLLEDSGINIESWLGTRIAERFSRLEGAAFVLGDGVGKPKGFLTYPSGTAWGQVEQVNMGAAAALTADGFILVKYALTEYFLNRGAWLMSRGTVAAAMRLKDGAGDYLWKPSMIAADPSSTILGLPVRMSPSMPAVAANALSVAIADWKAAYLIVDRLGITIQRDPFTVKPFVEFYTRKRVGGDIIDYDAIKIGIIHV